MSLRGCSHLHVPQTKLCRCVFFLGQWFRRIPSVWCMDVFGPRGAPFEVAQPFTALRAVGD